MKKYVALTTADPTDQINHAAEDGWRLHSIQFSHDAGDSTYWFVMLERDVVSDLEVPSDISSAGRRALDALTGVIYGRTDSRACRIAASELAKALHISLSLPTPKSPPDHRRQRG